MQIEDNEINASMSVEGTVTFFDSSPAVSKNVDTLLKQAQEQAALLLELERKMLANKDYLIKVGCTTTTRQILIQQLFSRLSGVRMKDGVLRRTRYSDYLRQALATAVAVDG